MPQPLIPIQNSSSQNEHGGTPLVGKASSVSGRVRYERPFALFQVNTMAFNTIATGVSTDIPWAAVSNNDPLGLFNAGAPTHMIAPVRGIYRFQAALGWFAGANAAVGIRQLTAFNGVAPNPPFAVNNELKTNAMLDADVTHTLSHGIVWTAALDIGDFCILTAFQTSGGNCALTGFTPYCSMEFLGPF